ncbi:hypothetical protein [Cohnella fermenti]|uniref:Uncharacterized protein n=1 Tax=Cohnella fermenti TaxID=2565925 RepID=A0A4S4BND9_9BACL|nr:hypothetical protein [Cohnella fermenti]THF76381.1 hypothetical protein E6C55_19090 [Cohnella fermenti]
MSIGFFTFYSQDAGVGQGYYSAVDPSGTAGLVTMSVDSLTGPARLVITRYDGLPPFELTVQGGLEYGVSIDRIQTIGILNLSSATVTGSFSISIPE